jgi:hypothetical protein
MSTERILIRGDTASRLAVTPAQGQIGSDDTTKQVILGDGVTAGGIPMAREDQKNIGSLGYVASVKTDNYTVLAADLGKIIVANKATAITFLLTAPATLGSNFVVIIKNEGAGDLTIDPDAAQIDGEASLVLAQGAAAVVSCDGSGFRTVLKQDVTAEVGAVNDDVFTVRNAADLTKTGVFDMSGVTTGQERSVKWPDRNMAIGRTLLRISTYTSGDTWVPLADTNLVGLLCVGGGGGGGGSSGTGSGVGAASGGGGGGMQERLLSAGWGASETVTVGAAGAAGAASGGGSGGSGGSSSVGTLCVATGGSGGAGSTARTTSDVRSTGPAADGGSGTGSGGTAAGLDVVVHGAPGQIGAVFGVGSTAFSGAGGNSAMGVGGKQATEGNAGFDGRGRGGGGGGGSASSSTDRAGGAGTAGIVIITEWS